MSIARTFIGSALAISLSRSEAWSQTSTLPKLKSSCQSTLEVVPAERLSVGELSKLGQELTIAKGNYAMTFWPFEPKDRSEKTDWTTIGVSLIQTRDIESPPVGLMILSTPSDDLDFVKNGHQILIGGRQESNCPTRAILTVTETGGVVLRELAVEKTR
jgi:hypothetical protein